MFTGLVEANATVVELGTSSADGHRRLTISIPDSYQGEVAVGDSVAVDGCCLSVVSYESDKWDFDITPETLAKTNLARLLPGEQVNIELAMRLDQRIGGHLVSGHIDTTGIVAEFGESNSGWQLAIDVDAKWGRFLTSKGSVAIRGVSLTVNEVFDQQLKTRFFCALIPITLSKTNLRSLSVGDEVALEFDQLAKIVDRLMEHQKKTGENQV